MRWRHGEEVAVVIDIAQYQRLRGQEQDFKEFLLSGPRSDDFADVVDEIVSSRELPRDIDWGDAGLTRTSSAQGSGG